MKKHITANRFLTLYCVLAILYTISSPYAPYALSPIIKALPIFLLMAWVRLELVNKSQKLLMFALSFSMVGDVSLAIEFDNSFMVGLGAFLVAHVFYILVFIPFCKKVSRFKVSVSVMLVVYCMTMASLILPQTTVLKIAVILYMLVLGAMCCCAIFSITKSAKIHAFGALVFAVSDSIIAWNAFRQPMPYASVWIMSSYYLAQVCIVYGCLQLKKALPTRANALRES